MAYSLKKSQQLDEYGSWDTARKRAFLVAFTANEITQGKDKAAKSSHSVESNRHTEKLFDYKCRKELIAELGDEKAEAKIAAIELKQKNGVPPGNGGPWHQPDEDTGLDGPPHREFKIWKKQGGTDEIDGTKYAVEGETELESAAAVQTAQAKLDDMSSCMAGSSDNVAEPISGDTGSTAAPNVVKRELTDAEKAAEKEAALKEDIKKQVESIRKILTTKPKTMMQNISETLTLAKKNFRDTKPDTEKTRYYGTSHTLVFV